MSRRRYLIAYDISDPRRLRRVIAVMESFGTRLQYSVFLCDLSIQERLLWQGQIEEIVNLDEDSVVTIDMGQADRPTPVEVLGRPRQLPARPGTIV